MVYSSGSPYGPQASNIIIPLNFVWNVNSQVPSKSEDPGMDPSICVLTAPPGYCSAI